MEDARAAVGCFKHRYKGFRSECQDCVVAKRASDRTNRLASKAALLSKVHFPKTSMWTSRSKSLVAAGLVAQCPLHHNKPTGRGAHCYMCLTAGKTLSEIRRDEPNIMKQFQEYNRFQNSMKSGARKVLHGTAECSMRDISESALREAFRASDRDGSGDISYIELCGLLIKQGMDRRSAQKYAAGFFKLADTDQSGTVCFKEFLSEFRRMSVFRTLQDMSLHDADTNGDGVITKKELYTALCDMMSKDVAKEQMAAIFEHVDVNKSGTITLDEVHRWYFEADKEIATRRELLARERKRVILRSKTASLREAKSSAPSTESVKSPSAKQSSGDAPTSTSSSGSKDSGSSKQAGNAVSESCLPVADKLDVMKLRAEFQKMNNFDGFLSKPELRKLLEDSGLSAQWARVHTNDFFSMADSNSDGRISFEEFVLEYIRMQEFKALQRLVALQSLRRGASKGEIPKGQVIRALADGLGLDLAIVEFNSIDTDHSDTVSLQEIKAWYAKKEAVLHAQKKEFQQRLKARRRQRRQERRRRRRAAKSEEPVRPTDDKPEKSTPPEHHPLRPSVVGRPLPSVQQVHEAGGVSQLHNDSIDLVEEVKKEKEAVAKYQPFL